MVHRGGWVGGGQYGVKYDVEYKEGGGRGGGGWCTGSTVTNRNIK